MTLARSPRLLSDHAQAWRWLLKIRRANDRDLFRLALAEMRRRGVRLVVLGMLAGCGGLIEPPPPAVCVTPDLGPIAGPVIVLEPTDGGTIGNSREACEPRGSRCVAFRDGAAHEGICR